MFRALFKLVLFAVVLFVVGAFLLGWWSGGGWLHDKAGRPVGTSGHVDAAKAREVGAQIGEKAATAASEAQTALSEGSLTAKIKAKMALDDLVRARTINVTTTKGVVTLSGTVETEAEHQRALQLARETAGIVSVQDQLKVTGASRR
jgi:hyperosmotically inducible periplasmic protein